VYKKKDGYCWAVAEVMEDVSRGFPDPFLDEMKRNTWEKSGRFLLVTEFQQLTMVPLLHACLAEHPRQCSIQHALHSVTEESEVVDRTENHYKCILREGYFFLVNILSLSVPNGSKFSAVPDLIGLDKLQQTYCDCK